MKKITTTNKGPSYTAFIHYLCKVFELSPQHTLIPIRVVQTLPSQRQQGQQQIQIHNKDNRTQQRLSKFVLSVESVLFLEVFLFYDNKIINNLLFSFVRPAYWTISSHCPQWARHCLTSLFFQIKLSICCLREFVQ